MSSINDLSADDVRTLAQLTGQDWDNATAEYLLPQIRGVLNAGKRIYELDLGPTELAMSFELQESGK